MDKIFSTTKDIQKGPERIQALIIQKGISRTELFALDEEREFE